MDPVEWGPAFWKTLHVVAANYPERPAACDQTRYREWFRGVGWVLPCVGCSNKYRDLFAHGPTQMRASDLTSRRALFLWTVRMHNAVNMWQGKPQFPERQAVANYLA